MQYGNVSVLLFEALSGVHISISRSVNEVAIVDLEFWIMVYASSLNPLDLPMEAKYKVAEVWNRVIEKVEKKLAIWQMQYLSIGGSLVLINNLRDSIPTYIKSFFTMPSKVLK